VVVIPFVYWVATIELGMLNSNDNHFTITFGQVRYIRNVFALHTDANFLFYLICDDGNGVLDFSIIRCSTTDDTSVEAVTANMELADRPDVDT
jgi:hypothetical protein